MVAKEHGLGKGLDALFGEEAEEFDLKRLVDETVQQGSIETLKITKIIPCAYQPRQKFEEDSLQNLTNSIREKGVLQPILVRPKGDLFEIVAGERRYRAAIEAGLNEVPVIKKDLNDAEAFEVALIENIMRENLNPIEEAKGFEKLIEEYHYTHDNLSKSIGKSRSYITNSMRLLELPLSVQNFVSDKKLSAGHARTLVGLQNAEDLAQKIIEKDMSVRQTEDLISKIKEGKKAKRNRIKDKNIARIEKELSQSLHVKAEISFDKEGKGKIVLRYNNFNELENLLNKLEK